MTREGGFDKAELMEAEMKRLRNAVHHLNRSQAELQAAINEGGPDADYRQAIGENIVTIARYQAQLQKLEQDLAQLQPHAMLHSTGQHTTAASGTASRRTESAATVERAAAPVPFADVAMHGTDSSAEGGSAAAQGGSGANYGGVSELYSNGANDSCAMDTDGDVPLPSQRAQQDMARHGEHGGTGSTHIAGNSVLAPHGVGSANNMQPPKQHDTTAAAAKRSDGTAHGFWL